MPKYVGYWKSLWKISFSSTLFWRNPINRFISLKWGQQVIQTEIEFWKNGRIGIITPICCFVFVIKTQLDPSPDSVFLDTDIGCMAIRSGRLASLFHCQVLAAWTPLFAKNQSGFFAGCSYSAPILQIFRLPRFQSDLLTLHHTDLRFQAWDVNSFRALR